MTRGVLSVSLSLALICAYSPGAYANNQLNFKIYSPSSASEAPNAENTVKSPESETIAPAVPDSAAPQAAAETPASADAPATEIQPASPGEPILKSENPEIAPPMDTNAVNSPATNAAADNATPAATTASTPATPSDSTAQATSANETATAAADTAAATDGAKTQVANKVLQGYIKVVPTGTKIPIIMDTAVDSDTSQEGDEFEARTSEDLEIDGQIAVPAGSVIKGRIASLNAPKHMLRSGSVALKFDTVTTPDNRQIPLVANLVARGGVVHARRGMKDIAMDTGTFIAPTLAGLAIGAIGGNSSDKLGVGGGAMIGVAVGAAVGVAVLLARKGSKIDVQPGDELKIELAEDLRMPTM